MEYSCRSRVGVKGIATIHRVTAPYHLPGKGLGSSCLCSYVPVNDGVYHTPLGRFSTLHISTAVGKCRCQKGPRGKHLAESFSEDIPFGMLAPSWLSSNRACKTAPGGCDIKTPPYTVNNATALRVHSTSVTVCSVYVPGMAYNYSRL